MLRLCLAVVGVASTLTFAAVRNCLQLTTKINNNINNNNTHFRIPSRCTQAKAPFPVLSYNKAVNAWAGPRDGKDVGASLYLAFAGANAYGGKDAVTTEFVHYFSTSTSATASSTAPLTLTLPQHSDVLVPQTSGSAQDELVPYNQTLWFQTQFPLWGGANASLLAQRFIGLRPIIVQTGLPSPTSFTVPAFNCEDVSGPVECGLEGSYPVAGGKGCVGYFRQLSFLTAVTLIAAPDSSNGSYSYGAGAHLRCAPQLPALAVRPG